jgi:hypothetical protein
VVGTAFVHTVTDDHSRAAYAEIHNDETAATATGKLSLTLAHAPTSTADGLFLRYYCVPMGRRRNNHGSVGAHGPKDE